MFHIFCAYCTEYIGEVEEPLAGDAQCMKCYEEETARKLRENFKLFMGGKKNESS